MDPTALKAFSELSDLSGQDREDLLDFLEPQHFAAGRRMAHEGTEGDGLLLVASGQLRLERHSLAKAETLEAPVALGAYSLVWVGPSLASVIAETPCAAWRLDRSAYRRLADDHPRVACRLLEGVLAQSAVLTRSLMEAPTSDHER